mgnify:CR=1 FL=1
MLDNELHSATVVVIDDMPANLRLLVSSLKAFGLKDVQAFSGSREGLQWLEGNRWDLLVLDLDMPTPNGFEILERLAERDRAACPVIIASALSRVEDRRRGLQLGANDYIVKPLDIPELLLRVRNNLQLSRARKQLLQERDGLEARVEEKTRQLRASFTSVVGMLTRAACYKHHETGAHLTRIGEYAALIARHLGQSGEFAQNIRLTAPMHDIGKIGIPDSILNKPGALTEEEREVMCLHARIGFEILHEDDPSSALTDMAAEIALGHHERWDGKGYPQGLQGDAIPLSARIVALCDVYDALCSKRIYKSAWDHGRILDYFRENAGSQFDPKLVQALEELAPQLRDIFERMRDEEPSESAVAGRVAAAEAVARLKG